MRYEKIKYPDGQISVKMVDTINSEIKERINSYEDLMYIVSIVDARKNLAIPNDSVSLFIPCMFGQRSDRRFQSGQSFDLKIIANLINSCEFSKVKILDTHSDVTLALINNSEKVSSFQYVEEAVKDINSDNLVLVSPDAGAYKKVFTYAEDLNLPVVAANKYRDLDGNINLSFLGGVDGKDCLIVDDLCDGGYTFLLLARALRSQGASKVYLYVSHGYFSKGYDELATCIDGIYCTNSVKDIRHGLVKQFKVI
jgi:ribose-phosphate pyrophosphokinase